MSRAWRQGVWPGVVAWVMAAAAAYGQDLTPTAPPQAAPVAIINATIHPIEQDPIAVGYIVFDDGVITDLGPMPYVHEGPGVVVDGTGRHVYPGLIGAVTQIGLTEIGAVRATHDYDEVGAFTPEVRAAVAINPDSTVIPVTRSAGILTVGVFPTGGRVPGRVSVIRLEGWTWEDMTILDDAGLVVNWPTVRPVVRPWSRQSREEQLKEIRQRLDEMDAFFSAAEAYRAACSAEPDHPLDVRFEAMQRLYADEQTGQVRRPVFLAASDVDQISSAVTWAAGRGLKAVIVGGRDAPLVADLLRRHDVAVIVEGTHRFPKRGDSPYDDAFTLPLRLEQAGLRWCLASGDETPHERSLAHQAATAVAYGLDPAAALRAITLSPAEILGVADRVGSLRIGKSATLILTDGNPLELSTTVERAFIDGRELDLSNKQTRLRDKYREKYRQLGLIEPEG